MFSYLKKTFFNSVLFSIFDQKEGHSTRIFLTLNSPKVPCMGLSTEKIEFELLHVPYIDISFTNSQILADK